MHLSASAMRRPTTRRRGERLLDGSRLDVASGNHPPLHFPKYKPPQVFNGAHSNLAAYWKAIRSRGKTAFDIDWHQDASVCRTEARTGSLNRTLVVASIRSVFDRLRHANHPRFKRGIPVFTVEMPAKICDGDKPTQNEWAFQQAAVWSDIVQPVAGESSVAGLRAKP